MSTIHPTAIVESSAELGTNVTVGPFSFIEEKVCIGDNTVIGPHVSIYRYTSIGSDCSIHDNAVLGDLPQDLDFKDTKSYVRIGSNCIIREGATVHRGAKPETATEVGNHCFLMANSHVGHNARVGEHVIMANGVLLGGYVEVGDRAFLGGNCMVHQFGKIGRLAMVGGGFAAVKDVPPFCMTHPATANTVNGLNVVGMRRAKISAEDWLDIKRAFRIIYRSGLNVSQAVAGIRQEFTSGPALEFCEFIESSKRGICRLAGRDE